ncbi:MAG: hypothetical protein JXL20_10765 [Deltaproteobacteria bacterium]|nr:hypothetical protein [Deltaproteobacteria bacterium]
MTDLEKLKGKLSDIEAQGKKIQSRFKEDMLAVKIAERTTIEEFCLQHAKFRSNEMVLIKKGPDKWLPRYTGLRDVDRRTGEILYYVHGIKNDGEPTKARSYSPVRESDIRPYRPDREA